MFFDPGRQKRGILPNQQMGRSLEIGKRYAIVVSRDWRDANGLPLAQEFRKEFRVGAADERPIDVKGWRVAAPHAGTRDALVVTFPEPLDHGLLLRALGVTGGDGKFLDGDVGVDEGEKRWTFTPRDAWRAGTYQLTALAMLEDLAGNRIGRAFEVDNFDRADRTPEPERTTIPFTVARASRIHGVPRFLSRSEVPRDARLPDSWFGGFTEPRNPESRNPGTSHRVASSASSAQPVVEMRCA